MKKTKETTQEIITIRLKMSGGHSCEFTYTDTYMAREHYLQLSAQMQLMGQVIKHIEMI